MNSATSCKYCYEKKPMRAWEETKFSSLLFIHFYERLTAKCKHNNIASINSLLPSHTHISDFWLRTQYKNSYFLPLAEQVQDDVIYSSFCFAIIKVWIILFKWPLKQDNRKKVVSSITVTSFKFYISHGCASKKPTYSGCALSENMHLVCAVIRQLIASNYSQGAS